MIFSCVFNTTFNESIDGIVNEKSPIRGGIVDIIKYFPLSWWSHLSQHWSNLRLFITIWGKVCYPRIRQLHRKSMTIPENDYFVKCALDFRRLKLLEILRTPTILHWRFHLICGYLYCLSFSFVSWWVLWPEKLTLNFIGTGEKVFYEIRNMRRWLTLFCESLWRVRLEISLYDTESRPSGKLDQTHDWRAQKTFSWTLFGSETREKPGELRGFWINNWDWGLRLW